MTAPPTRSRSPSARVSSRNPAALRSAKRMHTDDTSESRAEGAQLKAQAQCKFEADCATPFYIKVRMRHELRLRQQLALEEAEQRLEAEVRRQQIQRTDCIIAAEDTIVVPAWA